MSVEAMAVVLHHSRATGTAKLVLLGIANHEGDGGAWPSVATLARYSNTSERTVQRSLSELVKLGEVAVHQQAGGGNGLHSWERPNRYDVLVSCPITCDHTTRHRERKLPAAPADLWIEGVTPVSPGDASVTGGVTPTPPGGVTPASPKPSIEPNPVPTVVRSVTTGAPCSECLLPEAECQRRVATSGHSYTPKVETSSLIDVDARAELNRALDEAS